MAGKAGAVVTIGEPARPGMLGRATCGSIPSSAEIRDRGSQPAVIHPYLFIGLTLAILAVVYRREFRSQAAQSIAACVRPMPRE